MAARRQRFLSPALGTFTAYASPQAWRRGSGQYLFDVAGRRYLDCMAQNVCISVGYRHPGVDAAVRAQLDEIQHVTTVYDHAQPGHYAEELVARLPAGHDWVVHLVNSGAEAIDLAVLVARLHSGHHEVLTLRDAYHGMHFTAMAATGIGHARQPVAGRAGVRQRDRAASVPRPVRRRGRRLPARARSRTIASATSGALAAMIVEPIQGYGGIVEMPPGYLAGAAERVRAAGGLLVVDEVQTGFGRTGAHFWGFEAHGVVPDVIVMSKGIGNGFPIAAMVTRREIAASMTQRMFFNTYGSNPVSCAAARAVLRAIDDDGVAAERGDRRRRLPAGLRGVAGTPSVDRRRARPRPAARRRAGARPRIARAGRGRSRAAAAAPARRRRRRRSVRGRPQRAEDQSAALRDGRRHRAAGRRPATSALARL